MDIKLNTNKRNITATNVEFLWEERGNTAAIITSGENLFFCLKNQLRSKDDKIAKMQHSGLGFVWLGF